MRSCLALLLAIPNNCRCLVIEYPEMSSVEGTSNLVVAAVVEGDSDRPIVRRILGHVGLSLGDVYVQGGKDRLDKRIQAFNAAAKISPWLVLRDLDRDAACAAELVRKILPVPSPHMCFRVVVRASEAWLLADRISMSRFLGVDVHHLPTDPDSLPDPKAALVHLARQSRLRSVREDMVPEPGTSTRVGPGYVGRIIEFASKIWNPDAAAQVSNSLSRCVRALARWKNFPPNSTASGAGPRIHRKKGPKRDR